MIRSSLSSHFGFGSAFRNLSTELMSSNSTKTEPYAVFRGKGEEGSATSVRMVIVYGRVTRRTGNAP